MSNGSRDTSSGVSFGDVAGLARAIGKEHGGRVHFEAHLPVRSDVGVHLDVRVCFRRASGRPGDWIDCGGVSGRWPSGASATFAGLLFRIAYELSAKLDRAKEEAERAAEGQLRLL